LHIDNFFTPLAKELIFIVAFNYSLFILN